MPGTIRHCSTGSWEEAAAAAGGMHGALRAAVGPPSSPCRTCSGPQSFPSSSCNPSSHAECTMQQGSAHRACTRAPPLAAAAASTAFWSALPPDRYVVLLPVNRERATAASCCCRPAGWTALEGRRSALALTSAAGPARHMEMFDMATGAIWRSGSACRIEAGRRASLLSAPGEGWASWVRLRAQEGLWGMWAIWGARLSTAWRRHEVRAREGCL